MSLLFNMLSRLVITFLPRRDEVNENIEWLSFVWGLNHLSHERDSWWKPESLLPPPCLYWPIKGVQPSAISALSEWEVDTAFSRWFKSKLAERQVPLKGDLSGILLLNCILGWNVLLFILTRNSRRYIYDGIWTWVLKKHFRTGDHKSHW